MKREWKKSSRCGESSHCILVARGNTDGTDTVMIRSSNTTGRVLKFSEAEWEAFVAGVKAGDFD